MQQNIEVALNWTLARMDLQGAFPCFVAGCCYSNLLLVQTAVTAEKGPSWAIVEGFVTDRRRSRFNLHQTVNLCLSYIRAQMLRLQCR